MRGLFSGFEWRDALDVLLVSLVIYRVLVVFRGTRAAQVALGLGVLVSASLVAQWLRLPSLSWLVGNFWSFWVLALVVLFQPELRRGLARVGQGPLARSVFGTSPEESARVVDELTTAVETLAARRVGALVVLERGTGLRQYAELGVPLDALLSADLLTSIFLPYSPLHDGAVFVQGGRVLAAGGFLPLSRSVQVGRALGTRHRAALGVTEETDAVAIAVSEETGRVSVAVEGRIEALAEPAQLRRRLHDLLGVGAPAPGLGLWRGVRRWWPRAQDSA